MPRSVVLRFTLLALPLATAAHAAGCSSDDGSAPAVDAGADTALPQDASPPMDAADAADAADAGPDCTTDVGDDGLPNRLSCTGLYSDFAAKTIASENQAYKPGVEFWSDGAVKSRWIQLPAGATIDITNFDAWVFPVGTSVWKEFVVDGKRIETRLYRKVASGFKHTTYRWTADDSEALRLEAGDTIPRDGGPPYEVPSRYQCDQCHQGSADSLLGVEAIQLGLPSATGATLAKLAADGHFSAAPPTTTITVPDGYNATAAPALTWLHANCGACHQKNGTSMTTLQMRLTWAQLSGAPTVESLDTWTTAVNQPSGSTDGMGNAIPRLKGGSPTNSEVSIRSGLRAPPDQLPESSAQMPPIVSRRVDTVGHGQLDDFINQIPP